MKNRVLIGVIGLLGAAGAVYAMSQQSGGSIFRLRDHIFAIPSQYSSEGDIPSWLRNMPGLDKSNDVLLNFDAAEIAMHVSGYKVSNEKYKENITVRLAALDSTDLQQVDDPHQFDDIWYGTGSYKDKIVESYESNSWYRVFRKIEYPNSWAVLSQFPDSSKPLPSKVSDFWIAECLTLHATGKNVSCTTRRTMGNLEIEFSVSERNLPTVKLVGDYIQEKVLSWEK